MQHITTNATPAQLLLSPSELSDLAELRSLEAVIERNLDAWLEVGQALSTIYKGEKYKLTHKTWNDYIGERWPEIGRAYSFRLIAAAGVVKDLATSPVGDVAPLPMPTSERQVRPLGTLPATQRREVWKEGVEEDRARGGPGKPSSTRMAELAAKARASLGPERMLDLQRQEEEKLKRSAQDRRRLTETQMKNKHQARAVFLLRQAIRHLVAAGGEADYPEPLELMRQAYLLPPFSE